jgi:mono/diheme cytochrome c family protein
MASSIDLRLPAVFGTASLAVLMAAMIQNPLAHASEELVFINQGAEWTDVERLGYYSQDQGSQIMPLAWMQALQMDGSSFLERLPEYGYLPNEHSQPAGLPVGFTTNDDHIGMTCAACHTRQIEVEGTAYRIDGGPAMVDFQSFLQDLSTAMREVQDNPDTFTAFAQAVLGAPPSEEQLAALRLEVAAWFLRFDTLMSKALPKDNPWGPGRLDAVGMIFNRLTGLDIGEGTGHIIADNIQVADAPVRYPFLWNAAIQDKTQWPGFADNGDDLLALSRNLGEVFGVFANFAPEKDEWRILGVNYLATNSANFEGLAALENHIKKLGPPQWPWQEGPLAIDQQRAERGKAIYESPTKTEDGGCAGCHGIRKGTRRVFSEETWATPLCDVNTDTREYQVLSWEADTGVLNGATIPFLKDPLQPRDKAFSILGTAVLGSILQHSSPIAMEMETIAKKNADRIQAVLGDRGTTIIQKFATDLQALQSKLITAENKELIGAFRDLPKVWRNQSSQGRCKDSFSDPDPAIVYESRVMQGIWAAAPYLHNGSVPTLEDLLEPTAERPSSFQVGPAYDPIKIGLAAEQTQFDYTYVTTDCDDRDSGNSRCGHEYGTKLSEEEKKDLLEYLKVL